MAVTEARPKQEQQSSEPRQEEQNLNRSSLSVAGSKHSGSAPSTISSPYNEVPSLVCPAAKAWAMRKGRFMLASALRACNHSRLRG